VEYEIKCSVLEIYKESIRDLVNKFRCELKIKESVTKGIFVEGLTEIPISSINELNDILEVSQALREVGANKLNE